MLDGDDLVEYPTISLLHGRFKDVPLIVGYVCRPMFLPASLLISGCISSTSNETQSGGTNITASLSTFYPSLRSQDIQALEAVYPVVDFASDQQRAGVITGESELICAVRLHLFAGACPTYNGELLGQRSIMGTAWASKNKYKVFTYRYDQAVPGSSAVGHAAEKYVSCFPCSVVLLCSFQQLDDVFRHKHRVRLLPFFAGLSDSD